MPVEHVDIAMPRDLVRRRKQAGYCAVVAVSSPFRSGQFRIGSTEGVESYLRYLGREIVTNDLYFARVVWTQGDKIAGTIVARSRRFLRDTRHAKPDGWYAAPLDLFDDLVTAEVVSLRARYWTHSELTVRLRRQANAQADRFAAGQF